jgi:hypothetical membrane protein
VLESGLPDYFIDKGTEMRRRIFSFIMAILIIVDYLIFTLISYMNFPTAFSPLTNWLSDLGSSVQNPHGANFYNIGIIFTGIILIFFFIGLSAWRHENKIQNIMLALTQISGILGGIAMIMSAIFPIITGDIHSFWSASIYIFLGTAFAFSAATLRYVSEVPRWMIILGILVALENFIWCTILNIFIMEWITVVLFLVYIFVLGYATRYWHRA